MNAATPALEDVPPGAGLVLGAGGISGPAWEIGMLAGLARSGADLSEAGTVVGTSAGALVASWVASGQDLQDRYEEQLLPDLPTEAIVVSLSLVLRVAWLLVRHWADIEAFRTESQALAWRVPAGIGPIASGRRQAAAAAVTTALRAGG